MQSFKLFFIILFLSPITIFASVKSGFEEGQNIYNQSSNAIFRFEIPNSYVDKKNNEYIFSEFMQLGLEKNSFTKNPNKSKWMLADSGDIKSKFISQHKNSFNLLTKNSFSKSQSFNNFNNPSIRIRNNFFNASSKIGSNGNSKIKRKNTVDEEVYYRPPPNVPLPLIIAIVFSFCFFVLIDKAFR